LKFYVEGKDRVGVCVNGWVSELSKVPLNPSQSTGVVRHISVFILHEYAVLYFTLQLVMLKLQF